MRKNQLQEALAADKTVAYAYHGGAESDYAQEVRIVDLNGTRQVPTPGLRMYRTHTAPGIEIEFVPGEGRAVPEREPYRDTVSPTKLIALWEDYVRDRAARQQQRASAQQSREMSEADATRVASRLKAHLDAQGKEYAYNAVEVVGIGGGSLPGGRWRSPYAYAVRVAPELLEWLLDD